jgi:hypothetical protein
MKRTSPTVIPREEIEMHSNAMAANPDSFGLAAKRFNFARHLKLGKQTSSKVLRLLIPGCLWWALQDPNLDVHRCEGGILPQS